MYMSNKFHIIEAFILYKKSVNSDVCDVAFTLCCSQTHIVGKKP